MYEFFYAMKDYFLLTEWEQFLIYWEQDTNRISETEKKTIVQWSSVLTIDLLDWLEPADYRSELCKVYPEHKEDIFNFNYDELEKYYLWLYWNKALYKNNGVSFKDLLSGAIWKN